MEKKQNKKGDIKQAIDNLENISSMIKQELNQFYKSENIKEINDKRLKQDIKNLILAYEKKLLKANHDIKENHKLIKDLIFEYDTKIKSQEDRIAFLKTRLDNESKPLMQLEKSGFPKELVNSSKKVLANELIKVAKDNFSQNKQIESLNHELKIKKTDLITTKKTYEKKIKFLETEMYSYHLRNNDLIKKIEMDKNQIKTLNDKLNETKKSYDERIVNLKQSHEEEIKKIAKQNISQKVVIEAEISELKHELLDFKRKYYAAKENEKEFANSIQKKIKDLLPTIFDNVLYNDDLKSISPVHKPNLNNLIFDAVNKGDTKEKILFDLSQKGYSKELILESFNLIKK